MEQDVIIIGAGLSGICAAVHLQKRCPGKTYRIFEARDKMGGTWDLFRYPGIRSDSDMHTLGYSFKPWLGYKPFADGPSILKYINETAKEFHVESKIDYNTKVTAANWNSEKQRWVVTVSDSNAKQIDYECQFLLFCSGYYSYDEAHVPEFENIEGFKGDVIYPQFWPEDYDYTDKNLVVVGSGATAVTLVPVLAKDAKSVTMLQRSPTYIIPAPMADGVSGFIRKVLPQKLAFSVIRWRNILFGMLSYQFARYFPDAMRKRIRKWNQEYLGDKYDVDTHLSPSYQPWDQRLCVAPDGDLFMAINGGKANIVTDQVDTFTEDGVTLKSGEQLNADAVILATGLKLESSGGVDISVDGEKKRPADSMGYKGVMFSDIPNMAAMFGYTNASWTLKCELTCLYVCRLINHMDQHGYGMATPRRDGSIEERPWVDLTSGYIQRAEADLPSQGSKWPWRLKQNYLLDMFAVRSKIDDGTLELK